MYKYLSCQKSQHSNRKRNNGKPNALYGLAGELFGVIDVVKNGRGEVPKAVRRGKQSNGPGKEASA